MEIDYHKISRLSHLINELYEKKLSIRNLEQKRRLNARQFAIKSNLITDVHNILAEISPLFNEFKDGFGIKIYEIEEMKGNINKALGKADEKVAYTQFEVKRLIDDIKIDEIPF